MNKTRIWAHRGASGTLPENTMAAFELAIQQGADGIELDVQRTADGVLVVCHDEEILRLTCQNGSIAGMTFEQLRRLNFAAHMPDASPQRLPALADVLDLVRPTGLTIDIELKNATVLCPGLEDDVLRLLIEWKMTERVQLASFNHYSLVECIRLIREMNLSIPCGPQYFCGFFEPWHYAVRNGFAAIHPLYANLRIPGLVTRCHDAGIAVNAWTIDQPEHIAMAVQLGVDAVITNVPDQAIQIRNTLSYPSA